MLHVSVHGQNGFRKTLTHAYLPIHLKHKILIYVWLLIHISRVRSGGNLNKQNGNARNTTKRQNLGRILEAIFDRRLYGLGSFFLNSGPLLAVGFVIQIAFYFALDRLTMLYIYVPLFALLVLFSALGTKNFGGEVNNMGYFLCFLFVLVSVMSSIAPFYVSQPSDPLIASLQFALLWGISVLALTMAIIEATIFGQRLSLRNKMQLTDEFFKKQRKVWKEKLSEFPNAEKIISGIDSSRALVTLFDKGSFGPAVLWSCGIMERTIDAIADGIISRNPEKRDLFRRPDNSPQRYPKQLEALGFKLDLAKNKKNEQVTTEALWHDIRRNIAHYTYRPTFQQTYGAIYILTSFLREMPEVLQNWKQ
jgi:hypothetical protein